ncbi:hypothetical protein [Streptomyces sp900116325]|uniref:hypothetical protein n=1 Tax=Streptomyces sp. 900116325 TaxID=3154295 RepID=UPI00331BC9A6
MSEYAYCYKITKYDPADFDAGGSYAGAEDSVSDHGPVESAYLEAVAAFVQETGVRHLTIAQVDRERRRMALSHRQTSGPSAYAPEEDR